MSDGSLIFDTGIELDGLLGGIEELNGLVDGLDLKLIAQDFATPIISSVGGMLKELDGMQVHTYIFTHVLTEEILTGGAGSQEQSEGDNAMSNKSGVINQTNHFHVPVETPDTFANVMARYARFGLDGVIS